MENLQLSPAVSVIIPLYNMKKYIGECLDSILNQTFQHFELIVVDDCSTDNSVEIVNDYVQKFGGRMTLLQLEKNTGNSAIPRNKGFELSHGEYVYFVDADDKITENALEEMYSLAKEYDADVVYQMQCYKLRADGLKFKIDSVKKFKKTGDEIVLDSKLSKRIRDITKRRYRFHPWRSFCKRSLMVDNGIFFPNVKPQDDVIWHLGILIYAKKVLLIPKPLYFYRRNEKSILRSEKTPVQNVTFWLNPLILGIKSLDAIIGKNKFLRENPQYHYDIFKYFLQKMFNKLYGSSLELSELEIYNAIKETFGERLGKYDVLIPLLCTQLNSLQRYCLQILQESEQKQNRISELETEIAKLQKAYSDSI